MQGDRQTYEDPHRRLAPRNLIAFRYRPTTMRILSAVVVALAVLASACASDAGGTDETTTSTLPTTSSSTTTTTEAATEPVVAFTVQLDGGCMMAGPNCATYEFLTDGTVNLYRVGALDVPEGTGSIDTANVDRVLLHLDEANLAELRASLPEGECRACYDGIDTTFVYAAPDPVAFNSAEVELVTTEPLFAATWAALEAAEDALGPLENQMHGDSDG